ncbi:hypothetical protein SpCBS45565_g05462 [Spizellomyces sp. 'palustris']|nr:hypothetical protein SpCBS45565_g05462 [Spizellomyces sp. 'palustris']
MITDEVMKKETSSPSPSPPGIVSSPNDSISKSIPTGYHKQPIEKMIHENKPKVASQPPEVVQQTASAAEDDAVQENFPSGQQMPVASQLDGIPESVDCRELMDIDPAEQDEEDDDEYTDSEVSSLHPQDEIVTASDRRSGERKESIFETSTESLLRNAERGPRRKPKRKRTSPEQLSDLLSVFDKTDTPSYEIREQLAKKLRMTNREVQVWFQNRRAKMNRNKSGAEKRAIGTSPTAGNSERESISSGSGRRSSSAQQLPISMSRRSSVLVPHPGTRRPTLLINPMIPMASNAAVSPMVPFIAQGHFVNPALTATGTTMPQFIAPMFVPPSTPVSSNAPRQQQSKSSQAATTQPTSVPHFFPPPTMIYPMPQYIIPFPYQAIGQQPALAQAAGGTHMTAFPLMAARRASQSTLKTKESNSMFAPNYITKSDPKSVVHALHQSRSMASDGQVLGSSSAVANKLEPKLRTSADSTGKEDDATAAAELLLNAAHIMSRRASMSAEAVEAERNNKAVSIGQDKGSSEKIWRPW